MSATGSRERSVTDMAATNEELVRVRIEDWRRRLIDLSYRNRLINYRPTRATTIEIETPDLAMLLADPSSATPWSFYWSGPVMSRRPSGSQFVAQPSPSGPSSTTSLLPSRSTATICLVPQFENHRRSSCHRGDSGMASPSSSTRGCKGSPSSRSTIQTTNTAVGSPPPLRKRSVLVTNDPRRVRQVTRELATETPNCPSARRGGALWLRSPRPRLAFQPAVEPLPARPRRPRAC